MKNLAKVVAMSEPNGRLWQVTEPREGARKRTDQGPSDSPEAGLSA